MSLIRMLTTTRSLRDVKDEPSPYRMLRQSVLPKFGPRKQRGAIGSPAQSPEVKIEGKDDLGKGTGNRTDAGCSLKLESNRKPNGLAAWLRGLFRRKPRRERREPVQTELALDLVKVVRNDLSDVAEIDAGKPDKSPVNHELQPEESVFGAAVR